MNRIGLRELAYVTDVLSGEFRSSGYKGYTSRLEAAFASLTDSRFGIAFCNGTATMHAALEAAGIGPGDEVIVPALTMSSTALAVLHTGATPVFADIDPHTFQISAQAITKVRSPSTKAIIPVALYGTCPDFDEVSSASEGLFVVEDNAEALGVSYKGRPLGAFGHCASYSLQSSKHLTSGEGGLLTTDDEALADRVRCIQSLGYSTVGSTQVRIPKEQIQDPSFERHKVLGWNYRMSEVVAAIALAQVERANDLLAARQDMAGAYAEAAADFPWFVEQATPEGATHSYWTWVALLPEEGPTWHEFRDRFLANGGGGIYAAWLPGYLEPAFQNLDLLGREGHLRAEVRDRYLRGLCPVAESVQPRLLQFRTGVWSKADRTLQADALHVTLSQFQ